MVPFSSCPQSFPSSGSFPISQLFASGGQRIGASASALVLLKRKMLVRNLYSFTIPGMLVVAFSSNSSELRKGAGRKLWSGPWDQLEGWLNSLKRGRAKAHSELWSRLGHRELSARMWAVVHGCWGCGCCCYWTLAAAPSALGFQDIPGSTTHPEESVLVRSMVAARSPPCQNLGCRYMGGCRWDPAREGERFEALKASLRGMLKSGRKS